jgi:hypothetical protein
LNTISKFPLPGQVGVFVEAVINHKTQQEKILREKEEEKEYSNQFDIFYKPLPSDHQMQTLMQIGNSTNNLEEEEENKSKLDKKELKLAAYKCPVSLAKGKVNIKLILVKFLNNKYF